MTDYITRQVYRTITSKEFHVAQSGSWSDAKGGDFQIDCPGQEVLQVFSIRGISSLQVEKFCPCE